MNVQVWIGFRPTAFVHSIHMNALTPSRHAANAWGSIGLSAPAAALVSARAAAAAEAAARPIHDGRATSSALATIDVVVAAAARMRRSGRLPLRAVGGGAPMPLLPLVLRRPIEASCVVVVGLSLCWLLLLSEAERGARAGICLMDGSIEDLCVVVHRGVVENACA